MYLEPEMVRSLHKLLLSSAHGIASLVVGKTLFCYITIKIYPRPLKVWELLADVQESHFIFGVSDSKGQEDHLA